MRRNFLIDWKKLDLEKTFKELQKMSKFEREIRNKYRPYERFFESNEEFEDMISKIKEDMEN